MKTQRLGQTGESMAKDYLLQKGLRFVAANWRCKLGEIDLIMKDGQELVFVEVRLRRPTSFGAGLDTVAWQKQGKLKRAAQVYQQACDWWGPLRFDVVSIEYEEGREPEIDHIPDAF